VYTFWVEMSKDNALRYDLTHLNIIVKQNEITVMSSIVYFGRKLN